MLVQPTCQVPFSSFSSCKACPRSVLASGVELMRWGQLVGSGSPARPLSFSYCAEGRTRDKRRTSLSETAAAGRVGVWSCGRRARRGRQVASCGLTEAGAAGRSAIILHALARSVPGTTFLCAELHMSRAFTCVKQGSQENSSELHVMKIEHCSSAFTGVRSKVWFRPPLGD